MLHSSDELLKRFMWRYVDMTLNSSEIDYLKRISLQSIHDDTDAEPLRFVRNYEYLLQNGTEDCQNLTCVLMQLSQEEFISLVRFFSINAKLLGYTVTNGIRDYKDLEACIGSDSELFKLFVISVYYYF